ncbi:Programmed cell death protein 2, C-terminal putative domain [Nesidiocoris tenuis]|uniref:Programmed cell death protein 2, C-terminal putative domain n=1 Tax=Nesidiocoris tenuis TaxID=355587 RepID=A0ABN7AJL3_9HEMI|nr:Programmed cell death protein 2, C-terminal putative domain [Nesidiocoris tenuis]
MSRPGIGIKVLLGYEDESISEKYKDQVDYTTNKIGGHPDWPGDAPTAVTCKLCNLSLPLVLQIYAPLDNSPYHRTLYLFACINPQCWNQNGSWVCLRSQALPRSNAEIEDGCEMLENAACRNDWSVAGGDNWGDEENGNVIDFGMTTEISNITRDFSDMNVDDRNANSGSSVEGAISSVSMATATIEVEESEVVCIDTPTSPQINLIAMLEEAAPIPQVPITSLYFQPIFMAVGEEERISPALSPSNEEHIQELMSHVQISADEAADVSGHQRSPGIEEHYEKTLPAHGDKLFHQFVSRISANPGQILRYGGHPLPLYNIQDKPRACRYCGAEALFELQVLPTLIRCLRLVGSDSSASGSHLEFGTVMLFSCSKSCWDSLDSSYREEQLVVQVEKM